MEHLGGRMMSLAEIELMKGEPSFRENENFNFNIKGTIKLGISNGGIRLDLIFKALK